MRLRSTLACAAAVSLAACGQDAEPFPPSGATALAWCTKTVAGTLSNCLLLQSSVPGSGSWALNFLREAHFEPALDDGAPVEISTLFHLTVNRGDAPAAP
jgi:hypothetical protein